MSRDDDFDIIIVGSGVAGALTAWKLTQYGGYRILILEAGNNGVSVGQRTQFHHMMDTRGSRGDPFAPYKGLESRKYAPAAEGSQRELKAQMDDPNNYYDYAPDSTPQTKDPFKASYNRMVGGSTWSWRGNCPRFLPSDFKLKSNFGVGRDWPLDYDELEPWYCKAESELGVSGNHDELDGLHGAHRSRPFPMPGIPLSYGDQRVKAKIDGITVRGTNIRVVTTPQARNTKPYDNRPACEGHSNCIPLCPIGAKYDATTHLRRLLQNPDFELRKGAVVTRLERDKDGRVDAIRYVDWKSQPPREKSVRGKVIVLAAHAIETPKILLMSDGLANSSGQVGRNLNDHVQFELIATFPEPLYPFRGPQTITSIEVFRDGDFRRERSAFRMTIGNDGWGREGSPATVLDELLTDEEIFGARLPGAVAERIPRMLRLGFSTEMLPEPSNYVELSDKRDALGIPRPRINFDIGAYSRGGLVEGYDSATELFAAMGAEISPKARKLSNPQTGRMNWNTASHIMGTTIMGDDPRDSVVDRFGRTHDVPNLWIVGSGVFTTGATANPTLTIAALALRTGQAIHEQPR